MEDTQTMMPLSAKAIAAMNAAQGEINGDAIHIYLLNKASEMTNEKGREFIASWLKKEKFVQIIEQPDTNWFLLMASNEFSYAIPYKHTSCRGSTFGDKKHTENYLKERKAKGYL